jgi:hypothetical protein
MSDESSAPGEGAQRLAHLERRVGELREALRTLDQELETIQTELAHLRTAVRFVPPPEPSP